MSLGCNFAALYSFRLGHIDSICRPIEGGSLGSHALLTCREAVLRTLVQSGVLIVGARRQGKGQGNGIRLGLPSAVWLLAFAGDTTSVKGRIFVLAKWLALLIGNWVAGRWGAWHFCFGCWMKHWE